MDTHAVINLEAIRSNCQKLSNFAGQPVLAPIKAGAYGHGAKAVGLALEADPSTNCVGFAVATAFEVFELRHAGIALPVVLLTPPDSSHLARLIAEDSSFVVSSIDEVQSLQSEAHVQNVRVKVHLKVNTGLNRLGARNEDAAKVLLELARCSHLTLEGVMTHLVDSEDFNPEHATAQIERFSAFLEAHQPDAKYFHAANTGGVLNRDLGAHFNLVRPGIGLYGYAPGPDMNGILTLEPAMTLKARVIFVKDVKAGEVTSYNATWTAAKDTRLATIRLGYADGYPRALSNKAGMVLNGRVVPVAGRVCMDQTLLEIGDLDVALGDEAIAFGPGEITAETLAGLASTNAYELLTGIGARVQRLYEPSKTR
jgi:alanine racemase